MKVDREGKALHADIEEERRLRYVAYTRAKKHLHIFINEREKHLEKNSSYMYKDNNELIFLESNPSLKNYVLSYNARNYKDNGDFTFIKEKDPIIIRRDKWGNFDLYWKNFPVGRLSGNNSSIARKMNRDNVSFLSGFFVNDIVAYTHEDSLRYDAENGTDFTKNWDQGAKDAGYVYIVDIAGVGKPN